MAGAKINFRRLARDVVPRRRVRVDVSRASSDETDAMDGLLVLGAVAKAHAESKWVRVPIEEVLDEICAFSGRAPCGSARGPRDGFPETFPVSAFVSALGRFGLSLEDVSDGVLEAVMETEGASGATGDAETVSAPRLVILLGALCQGSFETKIEVCFRSMDAKGVKGITSDQATEFASACVHVFGALLEGDGGERLDFSWATAMWARCMKDSLDEKNTEDNLGMFTLDEFKALVERMFERVRKSSMDNVDLEAIRDRRRSIGSGEYRRSRRSTGSIGSPPRSSGTSQTQNILEAPILQAGLEYLTQATGGGGGGASASPSSNPGNIISKIVENVATPLQRSTSLSRDDFLEDEGVKSAVVPHQQPHQQPPQHRSSGSSNWTSIIPEGIAHVLGVVQHSPSQKVVRVEGMSDEDWEHAKLASEVENAKRETNDAEVRQIQQESHWVGVVGFVKEVVIRIFLFNTVRLLLTIALLGGDAALCVYVIGYFGTVAGLGFVVIINVAISLLFIWFIVSFNKRERGQDNMQFGANLIQNIQDLAKTKAQLEGGLTAFGGQYDSEFCEQSPRSWSKEEEPTPRAFGQAEVTGEERRYRRTVSGTVLGERV